MAKKSQHLARALVIVESPAKAKTINRYLGSDYTVMASMGVGFIFGPVAGGVLYEAWGFEAPFIASAAMGGAAFVASVLLVPETRTPRIRRRDGLIQRRAAQIAERRPSIWVSLPTPLQVFGMLLILDFTLAFAFAFVEPQMVFYFYDDLDWSPTRFGLVVAAYGLTMVLGQAVMGRASDRFGRKPMIIIGFIVFAGFFLGLAFITWFPLLILVAVIAGLGNAMIMPALSSFYLDITSEQYRSRVMGLKSSAASSGGVVGPLALTGASAIIAPRAVFAAAAIATLTATLVAAFVLREPRRTGDAAGRGVRVLGTTLVSRPGCPSWHRPECEERSEHPGRLVAGCFNPPERWCRLAPR
ncbi:MAG: MFS transporter [Planctomycetes bacterium]|nr:MFS transporter [Planctomycetota bacterium]